MLVPPAAAAAYGPRVARDVALSAQHVALFAPDLQAAVDAGDLDRVARLTAAMAEHLASVTAHTARAAKRAARPARPSRCTGGHTAPGHVCLETA